jgi:hypothetical protein
MSLPDRLWSWLTLSRTRKPDKAHPDLYPIEVERICKDLNLLEEAKRLGDAGIPSTEATVISGPEAAVIQRVEKARQDYVDWGALRLNFLNTDLSRRNITKEVNRSIQADSEFDRKANTLLVEQDAVLNGLADFAHKRKSELFSFRSEHQLNREANYPSGTRSYLLYALLLLLIALEAVLNAKFFAQGLDSGLLGGFVEAGIMAAINVVIAFLLGKFAVPYTNHRQAFLKALGFLGLVVSIVIMVCIGLAIAHYRDSLTAEALNPAKAALDAFSAQPLHLKDFFSWALFAISLVFGISSLFDGLFSDDLYPGYGSITRRAQTAIEDYEAELGAVRSVLETLKEDELASLDAGLKRAQADVAVFQSLIQDKQMAGSRLHTALLDADNSLDALLKRFRTENELYRKGVKRPEYFNTHPVLRPIQLPDFNTRSEETELQEQHNLLSQLLAEEQGIRARIQAAFTKQYDRLNPIDSNFTSKEIS